MRVLLLCAGLIFLSACSMFRVNKDNPLALESHELLQEQQDLLSEHSSRLNSLSDSQLALADRIGQMQSQIHIIGKQLVQATAPKQRVQVTESPKKNKTVPKVDPAALSVGGKAVLGRLEYVLIEGASEYMKARVDTGASSSSLNATNIQRFERNGDRWVRFSVSLGERDISMEAPLERYVRIRQASSDKLERRPVVKLSLLLGELTEQTEFTLSDRTGMLYPVLLGRSFLQDIAVVDVAKKFTRPQDPKLTAQVE
ncbi:ATP-dependent zinc protease family protein [Agarilytica rhodophyticola]|uniref:ATP-dependent zinc protease family protein n=1 Tax=Agarilytica rhodophyticola TaxID=1737490 RepID=UPI001C1FB4D0|nr:ATP-dependent zinc protease [Agarilytica rhodophyticola]